MLKRDSLTITVSRPGYETAHVTLRPVAMVGDSVSPRWHSVFVTDASFNPAPLGAPAEILTACPAESHCGQRIIDLCDAADTLLEMMHETDTMADVISAVRRECNAVYYG